jgi:phosphoserine phosphatase
LKKKILVVDLDGTLFKINTFHHFIKYLVVFCIRNLQIILLLKLLAALCFRVLKISSHSKMKYDILKSIEDTYDLDFQKFVDSILLKKRDISMLKDASFHIKILATAAPSCYANIIAKSEKFDICLATDFPNIGYNNNFENKKEIKKNNVVNYLKTIGETEINTLVTDHIDDLPLMKLAKRNLIVSPSNKFKTQLMQNQIAFEKII